jgi:cyclopropane fatty-acyl-phospholipid synthase-like methyltransferase
MRLRRRLFKSLFFETKLLCEEPFLSKDYQLHNIARLKHLDTLGLGLNDKTVIEFGAGIGDHTYFYLVKNCRVISTDARIELVNYIENRFGNETMLINIETDINKIQNLPKYDIIHCYGILYHISNPEEFLRSLKGKGSLLLLETCVSSDYNIDSNFLVDEDKNNTTQSIAGIGSRPTRKWIFTLLKEIFPYVYVPKSQPDHPEFPKDWTVDFSQSGPSLKRAVFVASENELFQQTLTKELPIRYD